MTGQNIVIMDVFAQIYSLGLVSILLMAYPSATLRIPKPVVGKPPEIWLSSYYEMDSFRGLPADTRFRSQDSFKNDVGSKNGSDFVIFDDTRLVKFTCRADYPITWKFPDLKQLNNTDYFDVSSRDIRISEFTEDTPNPINSRFETSIFIDTSEVHFLSINLTCSSVEIGHSQLESSIYIFVDTDKMAIENQGETLHVSLEPSTDHSTNNPPLVLPCRPATPDIKLSLEKEIVTSILKRGSNRSTIQKSWKPVNAPGKDLSFDPKVGFTLQRGLLGNRIFGLYKCSVLRSSDDDNAGGGMADPTQFVLVNVSKSDTTINADEESMQFESRSILYGDASVRMKQPRTGGHPSLICCSGVKNKPPMLFMKQCNSPLECEHLKKTAMEIAKSGNEYKFQLYRRSYFSKKKVPNDCISVRMFGMSSVVMCKGSHVDFVEQYVNLFHPLAGGTVTNRSRRIQEAYKLNVTRNARFHTSLSRYEPLATAETAPVSQKIMFTVGRQIRKPSEEVAKTLSTPMFFLSLRYYYELGDTYGDEIFELDEVVQSKVNKASFHILEYNRDVYYEGEPLIFICLGAKYFYTTEPHIRLNWSNGTKTILDKPKQLKNKLGNSRSVKQINHNVYLSNHDVMFTGSLVSIFGRRVIATREMSSVDCWMPLVNSSKWDKISKPVKVLPSVAPRFLEKEEETIYYYLGEIGHTLTCTLDIGLPNPAVVVTRDGRTVLLKGHVSTSNDNGTNVKEENRKRSSGKSTQEEVENLRLLSINLNFSNISHEHQTVIQCLAKNVNGTAKRTITVFVLDKPSNVLPISLGIVGILCALLVGMAVKHWRDKRIVHALRANTNI